MRTSKGIRPYSVDSVECDECPVSVIHRAPESRWMAEMESRNRHAREATGATLYGPDTRHWPAWFHDLIVTAEKYRILEANARNAAEAAAMST